MDQLELLRQAGADPKGSVIPEFYIEAVHNTFKSEQEGRPVYDDQERVRMHIPGDRNSAPVERVNDEHRARWPEIYAAFKEGVEAPIQGTPLSEWPPIKRSQVEEFAYFKVRTVEQLAGLNDNQIGKMPMGTRELTLQARAFVDVARDGTGPIAKLLARVDSLEAQSGIKDQTIADLSERLKQMEAASARTPAK